MKILKELYKMFEANDGGNISCARVTSFTCAIIGIILCVLAFFGLGKNIDVAYVLIGLGIGAGTLKSVLPQKSNTTTTTINVVEAEKDEKAN